VLLHPAGELVWVGDVAHFVHILDLLVVEGDQDAGNDGLRDASLLAEVSELDEFVRVPEVLRDHEVCALVTLGLELVHTLLQVRRQGVLLGLACHADAEVVVVLLPHEPDQVGPPQAVVGEVTAQRQDIAQTLLAALVQHFLHLLHGGVADGQVHLHGSLRVVLQSLRDLDAVVAFLGLAHLAPGHVHEERLVGSERAEVVPEVLALLLLLGREELE